MTEEPKGIGKRRRVTVPGSAVQLHAPTLGDLEARSQFDDEWSDRDWTVAFLQRQLVNEADADEVVGWSDEQLVTAVRAYAPLELADSDPADLDLAVFRDAIAMADASRNEEWSARFRELAGPMIDTSRLIGVDPDRMRDALGLSDAALEALKGPMIDLDRFADLVPKVPRELLEGLTDTSGIGKALEQARERLEPTLEPLRSFEYIDIDGERHRAELDATYEQTELLRAQGAQLAVLTNEVREMRGEVRDVKEQVRDSANEDRPWLKMAGFAALAAAALAVVFWLAGPRDAAPVLQTTPSPAATAEASPAGS